jgi:eukaryotic-like serine/threonine-protein kinase
MRTDMQESNRIFCTTCGAAYPPGAKFCGADGTPLQNGNRTGAQMMGTGAQSIMGNPSQVIAGKQCPVCRKMFPMYAQFCGDDAVRLVVAGTSPTDQSSTLPASSFEFPDEKDNTIVGKIFAGKYKIESLLGEGGMARVYKATHTTIDKPVVIKLMHPHLSPREKETSLKRFLLEIKVSAKLNHPNLVVVHDGGVINDRPYLVMEYIKGQSLRQYSTRLGALPFDQAINIVAQACDGLAEAHNEGIIHRDLKPENIMLREQADRPDWVKIVDFGIAHLKAGESKLTATGVAIGTVDYMSPEYLSDKPIDGRADIYAVGVILFELLTGQCPFESESTEAVMAKHLWTTPMPPSSLRKDMTPGCPLDQIVEKALEKEPAARYQTTTEMRDALLKARASKPAG